MEVKLTVRSDIAATNLFDAKINYDPQYLRLNTDKSGAETFIKNWVEQYTGDPGKISLVGGVPNPGLQTQVGGNPAMATLYFTALKVGSTTISFDDASAIYSNADNTNILVSKDSVILALSTGVTPTTAPTATPTTGPELFVNTSEIASRGQFAIGWRNIPNPHNSDKMVISNSTNGDILTLILNFNCRPTAFNGLPQANGVCGISVGAGATGFTNGSYSVRLISGSSNAILATTDFQISQFVCTACAADINSDGVVTILDFSSLAACFNKEATTSVGTQSCSRADINGSGRVTIEDFNCLADKFNKSCSQGAETGPAGGMDQATRRSLRVQLESIAVEQVVPAGIGSTAPVATPVPGTGDGNNDGKINLVDLSVLLSDFNKTSAFRRGIDLNGDGKINTFDFSLMRNLLIQKGVIRG